MFILAAILLSSHVAFAMNDDEVMNTVILLYSEGLSQQEIAKELIKSGATIDQLQRVQKELQEKQKELSKSTGKTASNTESTAITMGRANNGQALDSIRLQNALTYEEYDMYMQYLQKMGVAPKLNDKVIYGRDIFRRGSSYEPQMNSSTPQNYVLGAGDEVVVDIYGPSQLQVTQEITPDGNITIDGYGPVHLAGLDIRAATRRLQLTIGQRYANCQITLSVGQTRTIQVNVMGEVEMPGSYQVAAFATPLNVLYLAGGISRLGTMRDIKIYRANQEVASVDLYDLLLHGSNKANIRLQDGDMIIVGAYQELVQVEGKIKRPMYYEMLPGETMQQLLTYSGGFSGDANTSFIRVNRRNNGNKSVHAVRNDQFDSFTLFDGDQVTIDSILPRMKNTVEIRGAIFRPGFYGISDQTKTIRNLVNLADGPTEDAFTNRAVLYRMKLDRTYQAISIDLQAILDGTAADVELRNEDRLFIPSQHEKLARQYVVIHGEVFHPDTFAYAEYETIEDLILRAGGLTERASTSKVDIARRIINPSATEESTIKSENFTVAIDNNLEVTDDAFRLQPFDEVYVRTSPAYGKQMNVRIRGEVMFAGTYAMRTQDDRLSDLVRAAGGFSQHAFIDGARLQRHMSEEEKVRRDQLLKINKAATDNEEVNTAKLDLGDTYYVGIDLQAAIDNPGCDEDIILRPGDVLMIPSHNTTVKINGEVLYPNTVSWIQGKRANYYINQAGGYSSRARRAKAYVLYANGKVSPKCGAKIQPGCEIVVPSRPTRERPSPAQWVSIASASASLASVAATVTTLIINTTKNK